MRVIFYALSEVEAPSPDIYTPEEWSEAAETIAYDSVTSPPPVALVCGAKNCGKTTFSRHLLNILLQRSDAKSLLLYLKFSETPLYFFGV